MSGRIPQDFIDELIARADVAEVIGSRVQLKKAGREFKGLCPFHSEKTPSFTVVPEKGFYHCFGCGANGSALGFLMSYESLDFVEAVEALADLMGLPVPREAGPAPERHDPVYEILKETDQLYRQHLRETPSAIDYLKGRGIDGTTAAHFAIGFAPDSWDTTIKALGSSPERIQALIDAGLVIEADSGRRYDRFRNRLMFPIRDHRGRIVGFGGRLLDDGEPKYLNSPETVAFHKGQALYGLYEARQARAAPNRIVIVEGYMDVASLAQHGIPYAVATLGTATTADHLRRLTRLADTLIFCFDGDRAGRQAAWRAMENALPHARGAVTFKFLFLPEGEDPDSIVRAEGATAFEARLHDAQPLAEFLVKELAAQADPASIDGRARLAELARPLLKRVPEGVYRELLLDRLAATVKLDPERLENLLSDPEQRPAPRSQPRPRAGSVGRPSLVRQAISLALHYPNSVAQIDPPPDLAKAHQPGLELLLAILETARQRPHITTAGILERFRADPNGQHLGKLASQAPLDDAEIAPRVLADTLLRIVAEEKKKRLTELLDRGESLNPSERQELGQLLRQRGDG
jgi:DNA primase